MIDAPRFLVLNLPNNEQITRRYMCSYVSPESLMPPVELLSCAAVARQQCGYQVKLIDAIAEKKNTAEVIAQINEFNPHVILSLTGFECFERDVDTVKQIKEAAGKAYFVLFGHYATHFPKETLLNSGADAVILGEPEEVLQSLLTVIKSEGDVSTVSGISYMDGSAYKAQGMQGRIKDPNLLPIPAYDLLPTGNKYYEPLLARPYGMIQTIRGCPYNCNYCVKSYGSKLSQLTPERVVEEIKLWKSLHGVKAIRFIDDTFTINKRRVVELSKLIIQERLNIEWVCLSRTDNLDEEMLTWMKRSGCKRIYFGMESGSQRMLDIYGKNVNREEALTALLLCRKVGIETAAFFMAGHPEELDSDFEETLQFAKQARLSFASFNPLTPYPGTPLFDEMKSRISFSIYPYKNEWIAQEIYTNFDRRKNKFYKGFYMRAGYVVQNLTIMAKNSAQIIELGIGLVRYLFFDKKFVISGLKGGKDR